MIPSFEEQVKKSYAYNAQSFQSSRAWQTVRTLYYRNYDRNNTECKIPKIIHQIWLGSPVPNMYKKFMVSWQKFHPTWEYKLWTDVDVDILSSKAKEIYKTSVNYGMKSDILRYTILQKYGGLYIDTDFECLKPFDDLMGLDFFIGVSYDGELVLYNGLIASIPNHPIINKVLEFPITYSGSKGSKILDATGAYHFTRCFNSIVKDTDNIIAFPTDFFYPFPNNIRNVECAYDYIKPHSYALHHWGVSWTKKRRHV